MGLIDFLSDIRKKIFGYNEDDVYTFISNPKPNEIEKILKDKATRRSFYTTVANIAQKNGKSPEQPIAAISRYILQEAKNNNIIKSDLIFKPSLRDYEAIIGIDEVGQLAFNEKDPGMGFVRVLSEYGVGKRVSKKDHDKFVANVKNTIIQAYKVHDTVEFIDKALDTASNLSLVLGVGGLAIKGGLWLGKKTLIKAIKQELVKSHIQKIAVGLNSIAGLSLKAGDIAFIGSELGKVYTNTVIKDLPLSYSLDNLIVSGLGVSGYLLPKTKPIKEKIKDIDFTPTTFNDIKNVLLTEKVPLTGTTLDFNPKQVANVISKSVRDYINFLSTKKLSKEQFTSIQTLLTKSITEALGEHVDKTQSLLIAQAITTPNLFRQKLKNIYTTFSNFIKTNEDDFKRMIDFEREIQFDKVFAVLEQNRNLFELFKTNTSKALYNRVVNIIEKLKDDVDLPNIMIQVGDEVVGFSGAQVYSNEFMKLLDNYTERVLKTKQLQVKVSLLNKEGETLAKIDLPSIYIPSYDYAKVIHIKRLVDDKIIDDFVLFPDTLLRAIYTKHGNDYSKIHKFLTDYINTQFNKEEVVGIVKIYDPVTQLFPPTIFRELKLSGLKVLDEVLGVFPKDELEAIGLKSSGSISELKEFIENLNVAIQEKQKKLFYTSVGKNIKILRNVLKEVSGHLPSDRIQTKKLIQEVLQKIETIEEGQNLLPFIDEIERLTALRKQMKADIGDKEAITLIDKLVRSLKILDKAANKLTETPIQDLRNKLVDLLVYRHPSEYKKMGKGFIDVKLLYEIDPELARNYLSRAYARLWTFEERWLTNVARYTDDILLSDPTLKETNFIKTLKLIRDYQGADTFRSKWLHNLSRLSRIYTMFLPRVAIGAGLQLFSAISQKYPSFRFLKAPYEVMKELFTNPELKNYLSKQLKETFTEQHHYLSFWIRSIEPFIKTIFYNELMKNQTFRQEVLNDFIKTGAKASEFTPQMAHILSDMLTNLIDSPAALSPFAGGKLGSLAYIQSWFPFVVAPFQVALQSTLDLFKSPKHFANYLKHLAIGATILPISITPVSGIVDTVKHFYENLSSVYHLTASILSGNPEPIQSYLEKNESALSQLWKEFFSKAIGIPKDELTGRLFHDLGLVLALHGNDLAFDYVRAGLDFLSKHFDLSGKNVFSVGSVSTSFEVTVPIVNTVLDLLNTILVHSKEQPEQAGRGLIEKLMQTIPVAKNIKAGILSELTQYGNVSNDTVLRLFNDEELANLTGIGYFVGVMVKHPQTVAKLFDTMFLGGMGEAVSDIIIGENKKVLFLPKVKDAKSYQMKILGNEEYVLKSLQEIEDPYTKKQILLRFANIMDNYFDIKTYGQKHRDLQQDLNMFKSYLTFLSVGSPLFDDTELTYSINVVNKGIDFLKEKHNIEDDKLHMLLVKFFDDLKLRKKLKQYD